MTAPPDEFQHAAGRIGRVAAVLTVAGAVAALIAGGWTAAAGFALGAAVSWLNFRWLKKLVGALGVEQPRSGLAVLSAFRYLLMGGGAYVIVKYSSVSLRAALAGFLVLTVAVIIEALLQIVHARN